MSEGAGFILRTVVVGELEVNCYILAAGRGRSAVIIDPGADGERIKGELVSHGLVPGIVVNTHGHYDHIGSDDSFGVPVYAHRDDVPLLKDAARNYSAIFSTPLTVAASIRAFVHGDIIACDGIELKALHVPGHSPGGCALVLEQPAAGIVFTGDTLFRRSIGRTDFPGGDGGLLQTRIREMILTLPARTVVLPGHGAPTTVGEELAQNPFFT